LAIVRIILYQLQSEVRDNAFNVAPLIKLLW
jgi:hypothetical protein